MNRAVMLAFFGFGFCFAAGLKALPSPDTLTLINDENIFFFLSEFLVAFIKSPFAWVGIIILIIAFREPVLSRNTSAYRLQRRAGPKI